MSTTTSIVELIPEGHANAIGHELLTAKCIAYGLIPDRAKDADRHMRKLLHEAKLTTSIVNMQDGKGYFRPTKDDMDLLLIYVRQEKARQRNVARSFRFTERLLADFQAGRLD